MNVQERFVEVDAITDDDKDLAPKSIVIIKAVMDETTLIVTLKD